MGALDVWSQCWPVDLVPKALQFSSPLEMQPQVLAATRLRKERMGHCLLSKKITWGGARWQSECLREKGQEENWRWSGMNGGWSWIHCSATCWAPPDTFDSLIDFILILDTFRENYANKRTVLLPLKGTAWVKAFAFFAFDCSAAFLPSCCWFPGGLWCVSKLCSIRGISLGLTAQRICCETAVPLS